MGLDMYSVAARPEQLENPDSLINLNFKEGEKAQEVFYWRKFNHLHGFMERLYRSRGGQDTFNCILIKIREEDLVNLQKAAESNSLTHTPGFFFGSEEMDQGDRESIAEYIAKAREHLAKGDIVLYDSWW